MLPGVDFGTIWGSAGFICVDPKDSHQRLPQVEVPLGPQKLQKELCGSGGWRHGDVELAGSPNQWQPLNFTNVKEKRFDMDN